MQPRCNKEFSEIHSVVYLVPDPAWKQSMTSRERKKGEFWECGSPGHENESLKGIGYSALIVNDDSGFWLKQEHRP